MMTTSQERQILRLLKSGGELTIIGKQYPIELECKRAPAEALWEIDELIVRKGERIVNSYYRWPARGLYPFLASQMDALLRRSRGGRMNTVTPIQPTGLLTQAHREAVAYIQDLAITISLQRQYAIDTEYSGHVHQLQVTVLRRSELTKGNYKADSITRVDFYPMNKAPEQLSQLQAIARELESLLTPPTGDDAA